MDTDNKYLLKCKKKLTTVKREPKPKKEADLFEKKTKKKIKP